MISRSAVIDRFLQEKRFPNQSNPYWTDIEKFEQDTIKEVDDKLHSIDNNIWAKLIVMEKGVRTAKAYLRNNVVKVDGSENEFDGLCIGLSRFRNSRRESSTEVHLNLMRNGFELSIDSVGDVFLENHTGRRLIVDRQGIRKFVGSRKEKIFDLRQFRNDLDFYGDVMKKRSLVKIHIGSNSKSLECSLWVCLVHIIAMEMVSMTRLASSSSGVTSNSMLSIPRWPAPRPPSPEHHYELCTKPSSSRSFSNFSSSPTSSTSSNSPQMPTNIPQPRLSRAAQFEKDPRRNVKSGIRRRLDKSAGPILQRTHHEHREETFFSPREPLSSSIIDLRTLSNLQRPVYSQKPLASRGGNGHLRGIRRNK